MKLIQFLLNRSRTILILAVVFGAISGLASTGILALINESIARGAERSALLVPFIVLCLTVPLARIASSLLLIVLGQDTILHLRLELSKKVLQVPLQKLEEIGPPRILSTLTEDVPTITQLVSMIPVLVINAAIFVGGMVYLGWLSWEVLAIISVAIVLGVVSYQLPVMRAIAHFREAREKNDRLYQDFECLTDGTKELKLHRHRREHFLDDELEVDARDFRSSNIRGSGIYTVASSWGQMLVFVIIGVLLFGLPAFTEAGPQVMTGYVLVLLYLMAPLQVLMNSLPAFGRAGVALDRIQDIGFELSAGGVESGMDENAARLPSAEAFETIALDGVTHTYQRSEEERAFRIGPIDLEIHRGELIFIAGGNGSGKTTVAKILTGLYAPEDGQLLLDGEPVPEEARDAYRQLFTAVFFDFYLFRRLLGVEGQDVDERGREILEMLRLDHKVEIEDGILSDTALSQGQRKRLALLNAYLEDRPIYLFDEWAADQDPLFKEIFYRQLLPELKARGKTVVVISHDDRYYDVSDRIVKLEDGQVVAEGEVAPPEPYLEPAGAAVDE